MKHPFSLRLSGLLMILMLAGCGTATTSPVPEATPTRKAFTFSNTVISLTFDDGDADNYQVRSVLVENNLHATFFIVSGFIGTDGYMTQEQLQGLYADGNEIGGHTRDHINLPDVHGSDLRYQVCQNRLDLQALGFDPVSFAYPYGHYDEASKQIVKDCGFGNARIVTGGPETIPPQNLYMLRAMPYIVQDTGVDKIRRYVRSIEQGGGGWGILTFHHVCDQCDQYSITFEAFKEFAGWLHEQQGRGLVVKTVGEVVGRSSGTGSQP